MISNASELTPFLNEEKTKVDRYKNEVIRDYWVCRVSREASILARKEVLMGKANFGITGEGKELPQIALAKFFKKGDHRHGYYRDQTWAFALGVSDVQDFFAQIYGDPVNDPFSAGRQFNNHFATPMLDDQGNWLNQLERYNFGSDISSLAGQMGRGLGAAMASKKYRNIAELDNNKLFSNKGNEVSFVSTGDAALAEGAFWETLNAACVTEVPLAISVWDDGFGISVPAKYQIAKENISEITKGFAKGKSTNGMYIYTAKGWDYPGLVEMYEKGIAKIRKNHIPGLFHIQECTQPLGHSTSGSHERYKTPERMQYEQDKDGLKHMGEWMIESGILAQEALDAIDAAALEYVKAEKQKAWKKFLAYPKEILSRLKEIYKGIKSEVGEQSDIIALEGELKKMAVPAVFEILANARRLLYTTAGANSSSRQALIALVNEVQQRGEQLYDPYLLNEGSQGALNVPPVPAEYDEDAKEVPGYQVLNAFFDMAFERDPRLLAFGEDVGKIGDVNQAMAGLQEKYGEERVFDTGIREWTIVGQGEGMAMRGLRPIAEIQYLDYLPYAFSPLTDDVATLRWRSNNQQKAPLIVRTRGHRLVGIFHAGSQLGMLINSIRGMHLCVPRNMTQAAGMYNTLLSGDDPALVIEVLSGYRYRERMPSNLDAFKVALGVPEVLRSGSDLTLVTYGAMVRICNEACEILANLGIEVELIDAQTLLPFDLEGVILSSLQETNRILFADEDVPGGATAFMLQQIIEVQGGYRYLDSPAQTLTAKEHRPAYSKDGEYFSKPSVEDVVDKVYAIMHESDPAQYPAIH